jgi:hypothetical protein
VNVSVRTKLSCPQSSLDHHLLALSACEDKDRALNLDPAQVELVSLLSMRLREWGLERN